MSRPIKTCKTNKKQWTVAEDEALLELVKKYGTSGSWPMISSKMESRTGKQCRERYLNQLNPAIKKGSWTKDEDKTIRGLHEIMGNKWSKFVDFLPGRSDNAIKNRWHIISRFNPVDEVDDAPLASCCNSPNEARKSTEVDLAAMYYGHEDHLHFPTQPSPVGLSQSLSHQMNPLPGNPVSVNWGVKIKQENLSSASTNSESFSEQSRTTASRNSSTYTRKEEEEVDENWFTELIDVLADQDLRNENCPLSNEQDVDLDQDHTLSELADFVAEFAVEETGKSGHNSLSPLVSWSSQMFKDGFFVPRPPSFSGSQNPSSIPLAERPLPGVPGRPLSGGAAQPVQGRPLSGQASLVSGRPSSGGMTQVPGRPLSVGSNKSNKPVFRKKYLHIQNPVMGTVGSGLYSPLIHSPLTHTHFSPACQQSKRTKEGDSQIFRFS